MLEYTGHPFVDVGIATITAFAGKKHPSDLTETDLDAIAEYMAQNYIVDPLKSFLTVAFPNSGFTQPAYNKQPEKRRIYAGQVLSAYRPEMPRQENVRCVFTGKPATALPLDVKGTLDPGRTYRQHIPLITGEGIINFHPYGDAGLPISGEALLALQALPLGCAKVAGRLLAVHADDPDLTYRFARNFLHWNRKAIQTAQIAGQKKLPEAPRRVATLLIETLLALEQKRLEAEEEHAPTSITAYHFTNSGQGVDLDIYHLPLEVMDFLRTVLTSRYREAWNALCQRGWEITQPKKRRRKGQPEEQTEPRYNVLYEDLFRLPDVAAFFIRTYFLRLPQRRVRPGDPRATYSLRQEAGLVSWQLVDLFLRKVVLMDKTRIEHIRTLGDTLADYVNAENDRRFFHTFLTAGRYSDLRIALIKASNTRLKRGQSPLITFDQFIAVFEEGEEIPYDDWRLARDLVLIRMIECLYQQGWLQAHTDALPEEMPATESDRV